MLKKIFIFLMCAFLLFTTTLDNSLAQYEPEEFGEEGGARDLRPHREEILGKFEETVKFSSSGYRAESEHFKIRVDSKRSREELNLNEEEFKTFIYGVLFIFEEAYRLLGDDFDYYPSAKYDLKILSKEEYAFEFGDYSYSYTGSRLTIGFTPQEAKFILSDFREGTGLIYDAYATVALRARKGLRGRSETQDELRDFAERKGLACSRWLHGISPKERRELVDEFNKENIEMYRNYPEYLKSAGLLIEPMKCKWCGKEVDISGKKKGRRIKCPYCRNLITVER